MQSILQLNLIKTLALALLCQCLLTTGIRAQEDAAATDDFQQRLEKLDELLEAERVKHKIPGFAIAIVKDDEIVFAKGYGHSNVEESTPVTPETLFAIGSSTKSITGALVAMMVDEGKMDWDDPVSKYIPDFQMDVDTGDEDITVRDLLCHRTGFTRMGLLWASGALSREEVVSTASQAKPYADFREKFYYNNVMFMTAGMCAGIAAESDWDAMVYERIFKPLGMDNSSTSIQSILDDDRLSLGYVWDEEREEFSNLPMRNLDSIGPSGSINSSVLDMAQWIRLQLGKGTYEGKQLISSEQHGETWKEHIAVGGPVKYGLGWMLRPWNGNNVVEHGGNIDGFGAQVSLLPEKNTGYVLLTNVTVTPLQQASVQLVFDTLFGEAAEEGSLAGVDLEELTGKYIANFGPFNNQAMEVLIQDDGSLAIDVPGQMAFELKPPNDEGKWYFALTDTIAISFNRDDDDEVFSLFMYQAGAQPEFIREGYELEPETPFEETQPLLGNYKDEENDVDVEIVIRNGRLVAVASGVGCFALKPPTEDDDRWAMRAFPKQMQLQFNRDEEGKVISVTRIAGGQEIEMPRVSESDSNPVPPSDAVVSMMRSAIGKIDDDNVVAIRMKGTGNHVHQGARGTAQMLFSTDGRYANHRDFGKMAWMADAYDGEKAYTDSNISQFEELIGRRLKHARLNHPLWILSSFESDYQDITVVGFGTYDDREIIVLSLSGENVADRKLHVDKENGRVLKEETVLQGTNVGEIPITIVYSDFREVDGITLPFKSVTSNSFNGDFELQYESAEVLDELPDGAFVIQGPGEDGD